MERPVKCLKFFVVCVTFLMMSTSCSKHGHDEHERLEVIEVHEFPQEVKVASVAWDILEEKKSFDSHGKIVANKETSSHLEENIFVGVTVNLREKTHGILGGKNFQIKATKSGLMLDLSRYVKLEKGTFQISMDSDHPIDPAKVQVLFQSQSIQRKDKDQTLGSGCGKIFDLTSAFLKKIRDPGIEVNVTDGRHVSVLAGTFFIRVYNEKGVRALTQLTITDTNRPDLLCDGFDGDLDKE